MPRLISRFSIAKKAKLVDHALAHILQRLRISAEGIIDIGA
jgi:hypothetical protein